MNTCKIASGIHYADIPALLVVHGVRPFFKYTTPEKSFVTLNKMVRHKLDWELVCRLYNQRSVSKYILNYWEY